MKTSFVLADRKELIDSMPQAKAFALRLGLVNEEKLVANLRICKRYLEAHLRAIESKQADRLTAILQSSRVENDVKLHFVAIPCSELEEMDKETTEAFLSTLRAPPLAYPSVSFGRESPSRINFRGDDSPVWFDSFNVEPSLVIRFAPSMNSEKKQS